MCSQESSFVVLLINFLTLSHQALKVLPPAVYTRDVMTQVFNIFIVIGSINSDFHLLLQSIMLVWFGFGLVCGFVVGFWGSSGPPEILQPLCCINSCFFFCGDGSHQKCLLSLSCSSQMAFRKAAPCLPLADGSFPVLLPF